MTGRLLVIVGCMGMALERCWKRLCVSQWYSWKSNFVESLEALFKENSWSLNLKHAIHWCVVKPGPYLVLEQQHAWVQFERVAEQHWALRHSTRSRHHYGSVRRFLSDH